MRRPRSKRRKLGRTRAQLRALALRDQLLAGLPKAAILRCMLRLLIALSLATFSNAQTRGSTQTTVLATIHQFVDGFNKGDTKTLLAACADQTSILDEFPPHE